MNFTKKSIIEITTAIRQELGCPVMAGVHTAMLCQDLNTDVTDRCLLFFEQDSVIHENGTLEKNGWMSMTGETGGAAPYKWWVNPKYQGVELAFAFEGQFDSPIFVIEGGKTILVENLYEFSDFLKAQSRWMTEFRKEDGLFVEIPMKDYLPQTELLKLLDSQGGEHGV